MSKKKTIKERREAGLYWDRAWKLVEGCTKVSPGCDNCWSETETAMRACHPNDKIRNRAREVIYPGVKDEFYGKITMRHDNLDLPLHTRKPTVFAIWNDLFHEDVKDEFRDHAYAVMALCPQHTFLVLTKRDREMADYFANSFEEVQEGRSENFTTSRWGQCISSLPVRWDDPDCVQDSVIYGDFPLKNVHHGVTICNQQEADEKIPHLLKVPGKRFLSIEPMLGPVTFKSKWLRGECIGDCETIMQSPCNRRDKPCQDRDNGLDQVILGGESGPNARPMHPDWVRGVRDQCKAAGVAFMFKKWGEWRNTGLLQAIGKDVYLGVDNQIVSTKEYASGFGNDPLRMTRVGKKKAGRTLDGEIHDHLIWDD